jgi:hypothetical protein
MGTVIQCPSCRRPLHVATDLLAYPLNCPACKTIFEVTTPGAAEGAETRALERVAPGDDESEDEDGEERPWQRREQRRVRRDCEPHRGATVLLLGVVGLGVSMMGWLGVLGLPFGIAAWAMAQGDLRKIRAGEMDPGGHSLTRAGRICGIITTVLSSCILLAAVVWFTFFLTVVAVAPRPGRPVPAQPTVTPTLPANPEDDDK